MRYVLSLLVFLCMSGSMVHATDIKKLKPAEQELVDIHKARMEAGQRRDAAAWSMYVADDYIFVDDGGGVQTKAKILGNWEKEGKNPIQVTLGGDDEFQVRLHGDFAVLTLRGKWDDNIGGQHHSAYSRIMEIYERQNGKWLLISRQETVIPYSAIPLVPAHPELYGDYVGEYKVGPNFVITVTKTNDKLFEQWTGEDAATELFPLSESWFFTPNQWGSYEFVRDRGGKVIAHRYRDPAGEIWAEKIR